MAEQKMSEEEKNQIEKRSFISNARKIISKMQRMSGRETKALVEEILHSIFFLGQFLKPLCTPEEIISTVRQLAGLKRQYPVSFELYSSQLPRRSPFSCVLDMFVHMIGKQTRKDKDYLLIQMLKEFIRPLKKDGVMSKPLVSSTICVSKRSKRNNSDRYYGVSMSTTGCDPGRIMVAASCLGTYWDSYVAGAVMTYYPNNKKRPDFDGTFTLPKQVSCMAFNLSNGEKKGPCISCGNLFGLSKTGKKVRKEWAYGHCAEAESLSNLFKNVEEVRNDVRPQKWKKEKEAKKNVRDELKRILPNTFQWDGHFYTPR